MRAFIYLTKLKVILSLAGYFITGFCFCVSKVTKNTTARIYINFNSRWVWVQHKTDLVLHSRSRIFLKEFISLHSDTTVDVLGLGGGMLSLSDQCDQCTHKGVFERNPSTPKL